MTLRESTYSTGIINIGDNLTVSINLYNFFY